MCRQEWSMSGLQYSWNLIKLNTIMWNLPLNELKSNLWRHPLSLLILHPATVTQIVFCFCPRVSASSAWGHLNYKERDPHIAKNNYETLLPFNSQPHPPPSNRKICLLNHILNILLQVYYGNLKVVSPSYESCHRAYLMIVCFGFCPKIKKNREQKW